MHGCTPWEEGGPGARRNKQLADLEAWMTAEFQAHPSVGGGEGFAWEGQVFVPGGLAPCLDF